jgi:hypothetical protein
MRSILRQVTAAVLMAAFLRATYALAANSPIFILQTDETTFIDVSVFDRASAQLTRLGSIGVALGPDYSLAAASTGLLYSVTEQGDVLAIVPSPFAVTNSMIAIRPRGPATTLPTFASLGCRLDAPIATMSAAVDLGPLQKTLWRRLNRTKPQRAQALAGARKRRGRAWRARSRT